VHLTSEGNTCRSGWRLAEHIVVAVFTPKCVAIQPNLPTGYCLFARDAYLRDMETISITQGSMTQVK